MVPTRHESSTVQSKFAALILRRNLLDKESSLDHSKSAIHSNAVAAMSVLRKRKYGEAIIAVNS